MGDLDQILNSIRAMLQAQGIMPQPTSVPATTSKAIKRRASTSLDEKPEVKVENSDVDDEVLLFPILSTFNLS